MIANDIRSSFKRSGLLLPFNDSEDEAWDNKELPSDAQGGPLDSTAPATSAYRADSSSRGVNLLEVIEIVDDDDTGVVLLDLSDDAEVELWGVDSVGGVKESACSILLIFPGISLGRAFLFVSRLQPSVKGLSVVSQPRGVPPFCVSLVYCRFPFVVFELSSLMALRKPSLVVPDSKVCSSLVLCE